MSLRAVLISLLLCSPVGALPPLEQIVVVGDSITFGTGASRPSRAVVARLQQRLNMRVRHYGAPGAAVRSYPPSPQAINFLGGEHHSTDLVIVMLGINDYRNSAPVPAFRDSYAQILDGLDAAMVLCVSPLWSVAESNRNAAGHLVADYRAAVREACQTTPDQVRHYVDGLEGVPGSSRYFPDGLHPSDVGHGKLASFLRRTIVALYPQ